MGDALATIPDPGTLTATVLGPTVEASSTNSSGAVALGLAMATAWFIAR